MLLRTELLRQVKMSAVTKAYQHCVLYCEAATASC